MRLQLWSNAVATQLTTVDGHSVDIDSWPLSRLATTSTNGGHSCTAMALTQSHGRACVATAFGGELWPSVTVPSPGAFADWASTSTATTLVHTCGLQMYGHGFDVKPWPKSQTPSRPSSRRTRPNILAMGRRQSHGRARHGVTPAESPVKNRAVSRAK